MLSMKSETLRPRITETDALHQVVREMKRKGFGPSQIQSNLVRVAVVDLDILNEALAAA